MSAFYDQASLVVVPSGYKSGKIYAQKPLTTDGQLTFTRASTATRVNASGLIESVASGVPRLDYLGSTCPKLLLEPQRSNLVLQSQDISSASWTKGNAPTITSNIAVAPDGTTTADGIQSADGTNYKTITQNFSVSANSTLTLSFFVKKETSETAFGGFTLYFQGGTDKIVYGIVNAVTGTVTYASSSLTATTKVESYGNYWRIASTATDNGSNTTCAIGYYGTLSANGTSLNTGAGSVRTLWGFQAEVGAYGTSYIPTTTAAVTRLADAASKTGISSLIGQTEGTIYAEFTVGGGSDRVMAAIGGDNRFAILASPTEIGALIVTFAGGVVYNESVSFTHGATTKVAFAYKSGQSVLYVNGSAVLTTTATFAFNSSITTLYLSQREFAPGTGQTGQRHSQALLFKTRLTNAQLAELTTL
jgi:hypothetical protein